MVDIYLCCSPQDREVAAVIAGCLEDTAEAKLILDDSEAGTVAHKWEGGLLSGGILLLLSPEAVPARVSRDEWGALLDHLTANAEPPVASLLVRGCGYPRILERKLFFRWDDHPRRVLRAIQEWVIGLHQLPEQRSFTPARLPGFEGREAELERLWEILVDCSGQAAVVVGDSGSGRTSLAQEFARQASTHFRDVVWVACADRSPAEIVSNFAMQIGVDDYPQEPVEAFAGLLDFAGRHRVLLVFDDLPEAFDLPHHQGCASTLITAYASRAGADLIPVQRMTTRTLETPSHPEDLRLWRAMAVCRQSGFPIELAFRIAGLDPLAGQAACKRLIDARLVDPFDSNAGWMRLSGASAKAVGSALDPERRRHAEVVQELTSAWASDADFRRRHSAECLPAFRWAARADWNLACQIARHTLAFLRHHNRMAEATALLVELREAADRQGEWQVSDECSWELSWIRGLPYKGAGWAPVEGDQLSLDFSA